MVAAGAIAGCLLGLAQAAPPRQAAFESLRCTDQPLPSFPIELKQLGERTGDARIAISVDRSGKLADCLAVACTHPAFAQAMMAVLPRWTFEPARSDGLPVATTIEIDVHFQVDGITMISRTPEELGAALIYSLDSHGLGYRARQLRELDRIPAILAMVAPADPRPARTGGAGEVTIRFYVDESGAVRLPCADPGQDPELAGAAIEALRHWKFEPPTCRGAPVLLQTSRVFRFPARAAPPA